MKRIYICITIVEYQKIIQDCKLTIFQFWKGIKRKVCVFTYYNDKFMLLWVQHGFFSITMLKIAVSLRNVLSITEAGGFKPKGNRDLVNA